MTTTVLSLQGLSCGHCVASTRKALEAVEGTTAVEVSLDKAIVTGDVSSQTLIDAVVNAGYEAQLLEDPSPKSEPLTDKASVLPEPLSAAASPGGSGCRR